jgi:membrane fusion protein, multidrug efflux system
MSSPPELLRGVAVLSLAALTLLAGCGSPAASAPASAPASTSVSGIPDTLRPPVRVAQAIPGVETRPVEATGTLGPPNRIPLSFSLAGSVHRVEVEAGDRVRRGAVLATLDLREIEARLRQATEAMEKADRDYARLARLLEARVVPRVQVDDALTAREVARAALAEARVTREFAEIRAPSHGTVLERRMEAGERVQPGVPVLVVGNGGAGVFRAGLADRDRIRVSLGDRAEVMLASGLSTAAVESGAERGEGGDAAIFPGRVTRLGGAADPGSGTFAVEVTLDEELDLPAGMVGRVRIHPSAATPALRIPPGALLEGDREEGRILVLHADGTTVRLRTVRLGRLDARGVRVTGGLAPHEWVVVEGGAWVVDGDAVRVIR